MTRDSGIAGIAAMPGIAGIAGNAGIAGITGIAGNADEAGIADIAGNTGNRRQRGAARTLSPPVMTRDAGIADDAGNAGEIPKPLTNLQCPATPATPTPQATQSHYNTVMTRDAGDTCNAGNAGDTALAVSQYPPPTNRHTHRAAMPATRASPVTKRDNHNVYRRIRGKC